ncbi:MAG: hypothetical protein ACPG7F_04700 [Aggregatilineales bacterium]
MDTKLFWYQTEAWYTFDVDSRVLTKTQYKPFTERVSEDEITAAGGTLDASNQISPDGRFIVYGHLPKARYASNVSILDRETEVSFTSDTSAHNRYTLAVTWNKDNSAFLLQTELLYEPGYLYHYGYNYTENIEEITLIDLPILERKPFFGKEYYLYHPHDISQDGKTILVEAYGNDRTFIFYNPTNPAESEIMPHGIISEGEIHDAEFFGNTDSLVAYLQETGLYIYDHETQKSIFIDTGFDLTEIYSPQISLSPHGQYAIINGSASIHFLDLTSYLPDRLLQNIEN